MTARRTFMAVLVFGMCAGVAFRATGAGDPASPTSGQPAETGVVYTVKQEGQTGWPQFTHDNVYRFNITNAFSNTAVSVETDAPVASSRGEVRLHHGNQVAVLGTWDKDGFPADAWLRFDASTFITQAGPYAVEIAYTGGDHGLHTHSVVIESRPGAVTTRPALKSEGRMEFGHKVMDLFKMEKFDELEALVATLRRDRPKWADGEPKMCTFYYGLRYAASKSDGMRARIARAEHWVAAKPESVTARITLATAWTQYSWTARRGNAQGDVISDEKMRLSKERHETAMKVLAEAESLKEKAAELYVARMNAIGCESGFGPDFEEAFKKAVELDAMCLDAYEVKSRFLGPMWGGPKGALAKFAADSAKATMHEEGMGMYARIVLMVTQLYGPAEMLGDANRASGNQADWKMLKQGCEDLVQRYPNSLRLINFYALCASFLNDRETAQAVFARIGDRMDPSIWKKATFDRFKAWATPAGGETPPNGSPP